MLAAADADLVRRDPAIRGLQIVLDPEAVLGLIKDRAGHHEPLAARPTYVRYKRGTSCIVGYELDTAGAPLLVFAKAHRLEDLAKLDKALGKELPDPALGWGVITSRRRGVLIATPANDRDLPALALLSSPGARETLLRRLLPDDPQAWTSEIRPKRHKPERRWVGVIDRGNNPTYLIRSYRHADVAKARTRQVALAGGAAAPIGWSRRRALLASHWVPGTSLADQLRTDGRPDIQAVGAALARLHRTQPQGHLSEQRPSAFRRALHEAAGALADLIPELEPRARQVARRVARATSTSTFSRSPVHGDFSADQVIISDSGVHLIDFDEASMADPITDLASFGADLIAAEIQGLFPTGSAAEGCAALLDGYRRSSGPADPDLIDVRRAGALLQRAVLPFRERHEQWAIACHALLEAAEASLAAPSKRGSGAG